MSRVTREAAGLTREGLALALGLSSPRRITVWEPGIERPRPRFVPMLEAVWESNRPSSPPGVRSHLA